MSEKKIIFITGAASGIGLQSAKRFLDAGATIVAADINKIALEKMSTELGKDFLPFEMDVGDETKIEAARAFVDSRFGRLDALINNAATVTLHEPEQLTGDLFDREIGVNLKGPMLLVKYLAPLLRKSTNGSVVNICSVAALGELPGHYLYSAAKIALDKFTRDCTSSVRGVRHNCIFPGVIDTPILHAYGALESTIRNEAIKAAPAGRLGTVDDIAYAIEFLCSDKASFINGARLVVDGGIVAANNSPLSL